MDITINIEDYKLNIRVAGVIIHNGKILLHRNVNSNHYALIGGRVKIEFMNEEDKKIEYTMKNIEGKDYLRYEWIDLESIDKYPVLPTAIKDVLRKNKFPIHKINNDLR